MIGILTPYGRNEITAAAVRVADLIVGLGHEVRLLACGPHETDISPYWDHEVKKCLKPYYQAVSGCDTLIHFVCGKTYLNAASLVCAKALQILVPDWTLVSNLQEEEIRRYQKIICPTRACYHAIKRGVFRDKSNRDRELTWCRWDAGYTPIQRDGTVADNAIRVGIYCDYATIDTCGQHIIRLAGEILAISQRTEVTILATKSWSRQDKRAMHWMTRKWGTRFASRAINTLVSQMTEFHGHDWVIVPALKASFGMPAIRAMACGAPVIAYDIEPFNELIVQGNNGFLIPCEVNASNGFAPTALVDTNRWLSVLLRVMNDTTHLFRMQAKDWRLKEHRKVFEDFWIRHLDL